MINHLTAVLTAFLLAGCSYASADPTKLDAVAVGNTCAAARNETSAAVACSNPDKQRFYHALISFLMNEEHK